MINPFTRRVTLRLQMYTTTVTVVSKYCILFKDQTDVNLLIFVVINQQLLKNL